jgi:hypothetical protein
MLYIELLLLFFSYMHRMFILWNAAFDGKNNKIHSTERALSEVVTNKMLEKMKRSDRGKHKKGTGFGIANRLSTFYINKRSIKSKTAVGASTINWNGTGWKKNWKSTLLWWLIMCSFNWNSYCHSLFHHYFFVMFTMLYDICTHDVFLKLLFSTKKKDGWCVEAL